MLLGDADNRSQLGLGQLYDTLFQAERPEAIIGWMRPSAAGTAHDLLGRLGRREIMLSHDALDALNTPGNGGTANHLDAILTAIGALPARDVELGRLERAVPTALAAVADDEHRKILRSYATWDLLRRARATSETGPITAGTRYSAPALRPGRTLRDDWRAMVALVSGVVYVAATIAGGWELAAFRVGEGLDPQIARLVFDMGNLGFASAWVALGSFALAIGWVLVASRQWPSWLGWWAVAAGVCLIAARAVWTNQFWLVGYFLFWIWVIALSVVLLRRPLDFRNDAG